jgi:Trypsin-like peptidase domain/MAP3K TRAFs-binding domain
VTEEFVLKQLSDALEKFDWSQAQKICEEFIGQLNLATTVFPEGSSERILSMLRRKRRFTLMTLVADALVRTGQSSPQVLRQYAQAMIDQGNFAASRLVLQSILGDKDSAAAEKAEAHGLLGRIYKQLYVNTGCPSNQRQQENLRKAIQQYYDVYRSDPKNNLWHGINTVALSARAARDGVAIAGLPSANEIALEIGNLLQQVPALSYWDRATAVENAVALRDIQAAYRHVLSYVSDPDVDAFEIASLLRQLTEVWQLSADTEPGNTLLPTLRAALLSREGGAVTLEAAKVAGEVDRVQKATKRYEKVFGVDRYQPFAWYNMGLQRCAAVARIEAVSGYRIGTGLLVRRADFFSGCGANELVLLTNAHVISPVEKPFPGALPPEAARAVFEVSGKTCEVTGLVWSSSPTELDATFVTLGQLDTNAQFCPLAPLPAPFNPKETQRVYVIGYPLGGGLSISLQDSVWLDTDDKYLHYRTPTDPGSSGSPVFDQQFWTIIGLHHAGEADMVRLHGETGTYEANEGIAISAIQAATRTTADANVTGH